MKSSIRPFTALVLLTLCILHSALSTAFAQGTAFSYQGQLIDNGSAANGSFDFTFSLFNNSSGTSGQVGSTLTVLDVGVTNGLFNVVLDFGANFPGNPRWLALGVRTNGSATFTGLNPLQEIMPTPYAIYAANAGSAATATSATTSTSSTTSTTATSFSGSLSGDVTGTQSATAVSLVGGQTAANVASGVTAANAAASANTASTIVKRDTSGNFSAGTITATLVGNAATATTATSATTATTANNFSGSLSGDVTGTQSETVVSANIPRFNGTNSYTGSNTFSGVLIATNATNTIVGTFTGNGGGLTNLGTASLVAGSIANSLLASGAVNAGNIAGGQVVKSLNGLMDAVTISAGANITLTPSGNNIQIAATGGSTGWGLSGNAGTTPGVNFLGTTDNQSLELHVNGGRALRLDPGVSGDGAPNLIGGAPVNYIVSGVRGGTIGGGGATSYPSHLHTASFTNSVTGDFGTVSGGQNNTADIDSTVGGGADNAASSTSVVSGGTENTANGFDSTVGGGTGNTASGQSATVGGGVNNQATNYSATVPGGSYNLAGGQYSFAAGDNALATNDGAFVWADFENTPFGSTTTNQFSVRATGGVRFVTSGVGMTIDGQPVLTGGSNVNNNGNIFVGPAGNATTSGTLNTAIGDLALSANTTGQFNEANGYQALYLNTQGSGNTANGAEALYYNTNGNNNTATGTEAMQFNTSGSDNTADGFGALYHNTTGYNNVANGYDALFSNTSGSNNTANGYYALYANQTGNYNTADGMQSLLSTTIGSFNTALGYDAMKLNTTGSNNVAVGYAALENGTDLNYSTAVGYQALRQSVVDGNGGDYNTGIGYQALNATQDGFDNTAEGYQALYANTTGILNTANGSEALVNNLAGYENVADGAYALYANTSGSANVAVGFDAGANITTGSDNIDIGNDGNASDNGVIRIGTPGTQTTTYIAGVIQAPSVTTITIIGGSDLAEPFEVSSPAGEIPQGSVVVIDDENPGHLKVSSHAYDTRVAGVLSGANGIHPGIQMQQQGLLEGGKNVALTGRVYVLADAANGAIKPGDLLTTSDTPGRAMRVSDHVRAQGAILGKAMTALKEGKGMVLVLVTLQ